VEKLRKRRSDFVLVLRSTLQIIPNIMKLIVGLGNPGFRYRNTRHNIGFFIVNELSKTFRIRVRKKVSRGLLGTGTIEGEKILLFMPQTYMNLSGNAVREIFKKHRIEPEDLLVVYDDIDLKLGFLRFREKGSAGGHKGLFSIIESLGTSEFPRLRVGIAKEDKKEDAARFVLKPFDSGEKARLNEVVKKSAECVLTWLKDGPEKAMTLFNKKQ